MATRRRPRRSGFPKKPADVPAWLAATYGVKLTANGEPAIIGLAEATVRAESILKNRRLPWREEMKRLRSKAREAVSPAERNRLRLAAARAEVAMREGKRFPYANVHARSEFLITLDLRGDDHGLPFSALCFVAWWKGLLSNSPEDAEVVKEVRDLVYRRHW